MEVSQQGMEPVPTRRFEGVPNPRYRTGWRFFLLALALFAVAAALLGGRVATPAWTLCISVIGYGGIIALVTALVYGWRGRGIAGMLRGEDIWATWKLSPAQWTKFVEDKFQRDLRSGWCSGRDIALLAAGVWGLCYFQKIGTPLFAAAVILPAALMAAGIARWIPGVLRRRRLAAGGVVVVGRHAVFMGGDIFQWGGDLRRLEVAELIASGEDHLLRLVVINPNQEGKPIEHEFIVPVPSEKMGVAREVLRQLRGVQEEVRQEVEQQQKRFIPLVIFSVILGILLIVGGVLVVLWMERAEMLR